MESLSNQLFKKDHSQSKASARLAAILEQVNAGIVVIDDTRRITSINLRFTEIVGYTESEVLYKAVTDIFRQPDIQNFLKQPILFGEENPDPFRCRIFNKNNTQRTVVIRQSPIFDEMGILTESVFIFEDITHLEVMERQVQISKQIKESFLKTCPISFFIKDSKGTYLNVSQDFTEITGAGPINITGLKADEIWPKEIAEALRIEDMSVIYSGAAIETEKKINGKDYMICKFPIPFEDRNTFLGGYIMDISRLKTAEKELQLANATVTENEIKLNHLAQSARDTEENLRFALESSNTIAWTLNLITDELSFTENICQFLGIEDEGQLPLNKNSLNEIIYKDDLSNIILNYKDIIGNKTSILQQEFRITNKKGKTIWVLSKGKVTQRQDNGDPVILSGVFTEITNLKQIEQELSRLNKNLESRVRREIRKHQQQQALLIQKSKLESLGEMAAGMAHEINQPLGLILLSFESLIETYRQGKADGSFVEKKLKTVMTSINQILNLTDHMRVYSRNQTLKITEDFNMNDVVRSIQNLIKTQYSHHKINLILNLENNIPLVRGNKVFMEQVIQNLLSNARYAVEKKGNGKASQEYQKTITISTITESKHVCVHIHDNGTGISKKDLKQIFNPFFTTKKQDLGTGLGLSICNEIIKEMGGQINIESELSQYTLAKICLPGAHSNEKTKKTKTEL